jgi:hypothetical protein
LAQLKSYNDKARARAASERGPKVPKGSVRLPDGTIHEMVQYVATATHHTCLQCFTVKPIQEFTPGDLQNNCCRLCRKGLNAKGLADRRRKQALEAMAVPVQGQRRAPWGTPRPVLPGEE